MSYVAYIARRLRYNGITRIGLEVLARLGFNLRPFVLFREGLFDSAPETLADGLNGYETKYLGPEDMGPIAALAKLPGRSISADELQRRFAAGNRCLAVLKNKEMAAFIWFDLENCTFRGYPFTLAANEAYLFDAYTFVPFRGKNLAPCLRYRIYKELAKSGRDTCYSISDRLNRSSIRFKQKLNVQKVVSGIYIVLFFRWHFTLFVKRHVDHVPPRLVQPRRN